MRSILVLLTFSTLVLLLPACPPMQQPGPQQRTCLTDLECRTDQKCRKAEDMVLGYCRDLHEEPAASAPDAGPDAAPDAGPAPGDVAL
jgi:hypothetical protein